MANLKIVVAGPKGAGKTTIANYIAGGRDSLSLDSYQPTIGVRILEMEMHNASIELWDSSGDHS
jgi:GTPase SAR1 family protein